MHSLLVDRAVAAIHSWCIFSRPCSSWICAKFIIVSAAPPGTDHCTAAGLAAAATLAGNLLFILGACWGFSFNSGVSFTLSIWGIWSS